MVLNDFPVNYQQLLVYQCISNYKVTNTTPKQESKRAKELTSNFTGYSLPLVRPEVFSRAKVRWKLGRRSTVSGWANVHVCIYLSPQSSQGLKAPSAEGYGFFTGWRPSINFCRWLQLMKHSDNKPPQAACRIHRAEAVCVCTPIFESTFSFISL